MGEVQISLKSAMPAAFSKHSHWYFSISHYGSTSLTTMAGSVSVMPRHCFYCQFCPYSSKFSSMGFQINKLFNPRGTTYVLARGFNFWFWEKGKLKLKSNGTADFFLQWFAIFILVNRFHSYPQMMSYVKILLSLRNYLCTLGGEKLSDNQLHRSKSQHKSQYILQGFWTEFFGSQISSQCSSGDSQRK